MYRDPRFGRMIGFDRGRTAGGSVNPPLLGLAIDVRIGGCSSVDNLLAQTSTGSGEPASRLGTADCRD